MADLERAREILETINTYVSSRNDAEHEAMHTGTSPAADARAERAVEALAQLLP